MNDITQTTDAVGQITQVEMPKAQVYTDANTGVAKVSTDQIPDRQVQEAEPLPMAPNEHGVASIKPGEHLDTEDMSGNKNLYINKNATFDVTVLDEDERELLEIELKDRTVVDLAKRMRGLREQLGKIKNAPEEYTINLDPEISENYEIDVEDKLLNEYKDWSLSANVSQDDFNVMLNKFISIQDNIARSHQEEMTKQFEEYGIDAEETYKKLTTWASNNLSAEGKSLMEDEAITPNSMKLITEIVSKFAGSHNLPADIGSSINQNDEQRLSELSKYMKGGIGSLNHINKLYGIK